MGRLVRILWVAIAALALIGGTAFAVIDHDNRDEPEGGSSNERVIALVSQTEPRPGDLVTVSVENRTDQVITYGLRLRIDRLDGGEWRDVTNTASLLADPSPEWRSPRVVLAPGESASGYNAGGPGQDDELPDSFRIAEDAMPGEYRVVKRVSLGDPDNSEQNTVEIDAVFQVRH